MCSYLARAQREDVAARESRLWQRRDYCASWFSSQLLLTSFPGANDKYMLDRLLLNFTGRSHSGVPNRFPACIPLQRMTGHLIYEHKLGIMVKKQKQKKTTYVYYTELGIAFKKRCKRSIQWSELYIFQCQSDVASKYMFLWVWPVAQYKNEMTDSQ